MNIKIIFLPLLLSTMFDYTITTAIVNPALYSALHQARLRDEEAYKKQCEEDKKRKKKIRDENKKYYNSTNNQ